MEARAVVPIAPVKAAPMARWPRSRWASALRAVAQRVILFPVVGWLCRPAVVRGRERIPPGPVVFVANHSSHADTALILRALPARVRRRTAPGAAADYFFRNRVVGALVSGLTGAFPFPRRGRDGLERAEALLDRGWSVVLFPEGTRSPDGRIGEFRAGVGALAAGGATIVAIGIAGAREVLPRGRLLPRRSPVAVAFGEPVRFSGAAPAREVSKRLRERVSGLVAGARLVRPARIPTWYQRARGFARSSRALWLVFAWGAAEGLFFPIAPDVAVALLTVAAPARFLSLALAASAGSVAGGLAAYGLGAAFGAGALDHLPLVTERMQHGAAAWMTDEGARGLRHQPWSGVPFKVFGFQAADAGVGFVAFALTSIPVRGSRILEVALVALAVGGTLRRPLRSLYGAFALISAAVFVLGLARVVTSWS